jgi:Protein of unknown function (DUF2934)
MDLEMQERIARRAYEIWQVEGRPDGRHEEHWDRAAREIEAADSANRAVKRARRGGKTQTGGSLSRTPPSMATLLGPRRGMIETDGGEPERRRDTGRTITNSARSSPR